jgi:hypothetical protein
VVVRVTKVSVVKEPDVADVEDLVVWAGEELSKVLGGLEEISQPDHGRKIAASSLEEVTSQLHLVGVLLMGGLYENTRSDYLTLFHLLALMSLNEV